MEKRKEDMMKREVWDCGSSLYDSFELKSLQHQLDCAISARTMSMPHLSHHHQPPQPASKKHSTSRISRSLHKLLRSIFGPKHVHKQETFYVYDTSGALSTIPEAVEPVPEFDGLLSQEMKSLVTRTRSDRFMSTTSVGISCV